LTFGQVVAAACDTAARLRSAGIGQGDFVGLLCENTPQFVSAYFGIVANGSVVAPFKSLLTQPELEFLTKMSGAKAFVAQRKYADVISGISTDIPVVWVEDLQASAERSFTQAEICSEDVAACLFSSGTTGAPKGTLLTHGNLLANIAQIKPVLIEFEAERLACPLPLFHAFGMTVGMLLPLLTGGCSILLSGFRPDKTMGAVAKLKADIFLGIPQMYAVFAQYGEQIRGSLGEIPCRIWISGGAPLSEKTAMAFEAAYGVELREGYGMTEAGPVISVNPKGGRKLGSVGMPLPGVTVEIVSESGVASVSSEIGEIVVSGKNVMKGYLNDPAATSDALREGKLWTGDLGMLDQDGFLHIRGRRKELIIVRGMNVFPREVEEVLQQLPGVTEVCAMGIADDRDDEAVFAAIGVGKTEVTEKFAKDFCRDKLADYKVPKRILVLPELPKLATGKIDKKALLSSVA